MPASRAAPVTPASAMKLRRERSRRAVFEKAIWILPCGARMRRVRARNLRAARQRRLLCILHLHMKRAQRKARNGDTRDPLFNQSVEKALAILEVFGGE